MRQPLNMSSAVIAVRQNIYQDVQYRDAVRVMPFTDIQYAGAEVAGTNSVIASCSIPMVTGLSLGKDQTKGSNPNFANDVSWSRNKLLKQFKVVTDPATGTPIMSNESNANWLATGYGLSDYLMGINQTASRVSLDRGGKSFNQIRLANYSSSGFSDPTKGMSAADTRAAFEEQFETSVDGTYPIRVEQWTNEDAALDAITRNPSEMIIGYVIGPRDVKLYYTETAISMLVRRLGRAVEALGPLQPMHAPIGLGHLVDAKMSGKGKHKRHQPWAPHQGLNDPKVHQPTLFWDAGNVTYGHRALPAAGSMYIPSDQVPYSQQKRGFKFNHILTQLGLELMETLQAIGCSMDENLDYKNNAYQDEGVDGQKAGLEVAALQVLFSSIFGSAPGATNAADFTADEASVASGMKEMLGMMFNSGHIHIDPGVMSYNHTLPGTTMLNDKNSGSSFRYKGIQISPALMMKEFVSKFVTFCAVATALRSYFQVPLWQCHWLYVGSPKPEYVTEQLQMNFRSDVYYDGSDSTLPFTLIPSTLNPGEVLSRVPCMIDMRATEAERPNRYLGIRDPLPYGSVDDLRFYGDRPVTVIEEKEYTFTPIIEADASVQTTYRNSRTVNCALWPRPTVYCPGTTRLGAIYGIMSDNASVGGHYYYQYLTGAFQNENVADVLYRAMADDNDTTTAGWLLAGQTKQDEEKHVEYWTKHAIPADVNPQERDPPEMMGGPALKAEVGQVLP